MPTAIGDQSELNSCPIAAERAARPARFLLGAGHVRDSQPPLKEIHTRSMQQLPLRRHRLNSLNILRHPRSNDLLHGKHTRACAREGPTSACSSANGFTT